MSIHVTVSSNPVCISRSKVLLADLEQAKKNEWNRRRKLRLQQVRQQSRDLANNLRKKCNAEKKLSEQQENDENEIELKQWQAKQLEKLQEAYERGLAAVGTAHRSAHSQIENDENAKEKQELRDALAKARGDLARERAKLLSASVKPSVSVKCISNKGKTPNVTASTSQGLVRNKNKNIQSKSILKQNSGFECTKKIEINENVPTECTISSPGHNIKLQIKPKAIRSVAPKVIRRQRSHSPSSNTVTTVKDVSIDSSDDSEDSNVTWPPRTTRNTKIDYSPIKVRLYNHDERISKDYLQPCKSVTHIESEENEMEKYIEEEEEAVQKKSELDAAIKKISDTRGQQALRKERLEREFKTLEQKYSEVDKQQKIARIFEFPYPFKETKEHKVNKENEGKNKFSKAVPHTSKEADKSVEDKVALDTSVKAGKSRGGNAAQDLNKCFEVAALKEKQADKKHETSADLSFSPNPFTLKKLIKDLEKERDLLLNSSLEKSMSDLERSLTNKDISPKKNDVKKDSITIGKNNENIAGKESIKEKPPHPLEVNVIAKPLCNCCDSCKCSNKIQTSNNENNDQSHPELKQSKRNSLDNEKPSKSPKKNEHRESLDESHPNDIHKKESSSSDNEVVSTICGNDIKITVKVMEKNKNKLTSDNQPFVEAENIEHDSPWKYRLNGPIENINSSSSYCSPPDKLSPAQESILNTILLKMCLKNKNPQLHKYIKRLLCMNKSNIDNIPVSSPSEVSIQSDVFNNINLDNITGTYQLNEPSSNRRKHVRIVETEGDNKSKTAKKKIIQLNSSSEDSIVQEKCPIQKEIPKNNQSKIKNLAEEYSLRLKDLVQMLNQVSPKVIRGSELNDNYDSSSYMYPPLERNRLFERFSSSNGYDSNFISLLENGSTGINSENSDDNGRHEENQQVSSFLRNNINSFGLPFELLPKPFTLEVEDNGESLSKPKPPAASAKYRVEGHLPHELSAIPEVSSRFCSRTQGLYSTRDEQDYSDLNEEYLSDTDLLDLSSIKDTSPMKTLKRQSITQSQESVKCIQIDSSSLSILSHMTNESQVEIKSDSTDSNLDTSSSDYIEQVFRSLGVGWALSTLKKTRESRQKDNNTSSSPSYNDSYVMIERKRSKSNSRTKINRSHSTPKKFIETQQTQTTSGDEDLHKKFKALKNDKLSLTPPDLTLKIPNLGNYQ